jgi:hypothetical protein
MHRVTTNSTIRRRVLGKLPKSTSTSGRKAAQVCGCFVSSSSKFLPFSEKELDFHQLRRRQTKTYTIFFYISLNLICLHVRGVGVSLVLNDVVLFPISVSGQIIPSLYLLLKIQAARTLRSCVTSQTKKRETSFISAISTVCT